MSLSPRPNRFIRGSAAVALEDDELLRGASISRSSSGRSFTGGFQVDWDEIDSIAEETLSVASSGSGGHRKRRPSSRRRAASAPLSQLDNLETGSLSRYTTSGASLAGSTRSRSSGSLNGRGSSGSHHRTRIKGHTKPSLSKKLQMNDAKRLAVIGGLAICALFGVHICGVFISNALKPSTTAYRSARRALSRSAEIYQTRRWPVSVRDEQDDFELIPHPANPKVTLALPRFFLTKEDGTMETLGGIKTLSKDMANMIGRTTVDGSRDFSVRTIFVGIPSFRDLHCRHTVESLFSRAKYPERIRVGVVDQINSEKDQSCDVPIVPCAKKPEQALCQYRSQIDVYEMDHKLAVGPTFARHVVNRLYRGEYYALQIDAHTTFTMDWDVEIIEQLEETGNEMAVLTTYLNDATENVDSKTGVSHKDSRVVLCNAAYVGSGHERFLRHDLDEQPDILPGVKSMPQLQPFWAAQFSFSRGHFILSVPYDPHLSMAQTPDEEISMAIRGFTHGYDFYTPQKNVCYDSAFHDKRSLKSFLDNRAIYKNAEQTTFLRLYGLLQMDTAGKEESKWETELDELFGVGQSRPIAKFHSSFGIHVRERITERKLCNFVSGGRMHKMFHEHMREDGMGLNYDQINFRFHELQNDHES